MLVFVLMMKVTRLCVSRQCSLKTYCLISTGGRLGRLCQQMNLLHLLLVSSSHCKTRFIWPQIFNIFGVTSRKKVKCIEKFRTKSVTEIVEEFVSNVIVILTFTSAASFQMSGQSLSCDNRYTMVTVPHNRCRARNKLSTF